jgi:hypothetical protein
MKRIRKILDIGSIVQSIFADGAATIRVAESGLDLSILGALGAGVRVGSGAPIMCFNSAGAVAYVSFGVQGLAAPTGPTNGIPVPAGQSIMLNSGDQEWIRSSAATVYGYQADM